MLCFKHYRYGLLAQAGQCNSNKVLYTDAKEKAERPELTSLTFYIRGDNSHLDSRSAGCS